MHQKILEAEISLTMRFSVDEGVSGPVDFKMGSDYKSSKILAKFEIRMYHTHKEKLLRFSFL